MEEFFKPFPTEQRGDPNEKVYADNWFTGHIRQRKKENKPSPSILLAFITHSFKKRKKKTKNQNNQTSSNQIRLTD